VDVVTLVTDPNINQEEESIVAGLGSGTCLDFNSHHDHLFLIGTEELLIIINFWKHMNLIIWLFILLNGIHFIQKFLLHVLPIGQSRYGIIRASENK
jgi:hypothetical protein